jgi:hypothetical protein
MYIYWIDYNWTRRPQRKTISEKMGKKMKFPQICETRKLPFLDFFGIFFLKLKTTWLNWLGLIGLAWLASPELIQGPGVLPNRGTSLYIREIRKIGL